MMNRLTSRQKSLVNELRQLMTLLQLDVDDILSHTSGKWRTTHLEIARDKLIRGQVVVWYTYVDELLNVALCRYFFGRRADFIKLWKTKRFKHFNHYILETLTLLEKLAFVRAIHEVPKAIVRNIEQLNAVRNGVAHAFFPQNLRRNRPEYKGRKVLSLEGMTLLKADFETITAYIAQVAPWSV